MARKQKGRGPAADWAKATNWIVPLDAKAPKLPRATSWLNYPLFMFERYPHLRPKPARDFMRRQQLLSGKRCFEEQVEEWDQRLSSQLPSVVEGLKKRQRRQLAALLLETIVKMEEFQQRRDKHRKYMKLAKEGPRRQEMLRTKLRRARVVAKSLRDYAAGLDPLLGAARVALVAEEAQKQLEKAGDPRDLVPDFSGLIKSGKSNFDPKFYMVPTSPIDQSTLSLYGFLLHECQLTGDESEVRTGKLRNAFWTLYGIPRVGVREKYGDAESKGCESVHR